MDTNQVFTKDIRDRIGALTAMQRSILSSTIARVMRSRPEHRDWQDVDWDKVLSAVEGWSPGDDDPDPGVVYQRDLDAVASDDNPFAAWCATLSVRELNKLTRWFRIQKKAGTLPPTIPIAELQAVLER